MGQNRAGDVVVGLMMIAIGLSPIGLVLLSQLRPTDVAAGFGINNTRVGAVLTIVIGLFGLFLAEMGVLTLRYGRSMSTSSLY